jgi:O-antigen ligase
MSEAPRRHLLLVAVLLSGAVVTASIGMVLRDGMLPAAAAALLVAGLLTWKRVYSWPALVAGLLLIVLFVPIRRFTLGESLPFELELYRLIVIALVAGWLLSSLVDPTVRLRRTKSDAALLTIAIVILLSLVVNHERIGDVQANVVKSVVFFATYLMLFFFITSVITRRRDIDRLVKVLVVGGAVVAALAIVEARVGFNPYDRALDHVPGLQRTVDEAFDMDRGVRAYGPAQHPIALAAALIMLLPLAISLAYRTGHRRWWIATFLMTVAAFATLSRTAIVMLAVVAAVLFWLRRTEMVRAAPFAAALVVGIHFVSPGALGTMKSVFFPEGGLITDQSRVWVTTVDPDHPSWCSYAGRLADIEPALREARDRPFLGYGYGTRITVDDEGQGLTANACVLDNQWLANLLDVGLVGVLAWGWLLFGFMRRARAAARRADDDTAWLLAAFVASVATATVGMFLFDAFAFIQVMLLLFTVLGLGAASLAPLDAEEPEQAPAMSPAQAAAVP